MAGDLKSVLMCPPTYFRVEYVINPWMKPGIVNTATAIEQWEQLVGVLRDLEVEVQIIEPVAEFPDMVFAADQGLVLDNHVILSAMCYAERQGEVKLYQQWFEERGYTTERLAAGCFEGGECLRMGETFFVGTGFRASRTATESLQTLLKQNVVALDLVDSRYYHLDTCFFPVNDTTAFYYPPAFSQSSQKVLQELVPQLLEFTQEEVEAFAANSIVIQDTVIHAAGNQVFSQRLKKLGFSSIEVSISEFIKAGGGIHCMILPLSYAQERKHYAN